MKYKWNGVPQHTGTEEYACEFRLTGEDVEAGKYDTISASGDFTFRPTDLRLVWERDRGGAWTPKAYCVRTGGSRICGPRVRKDGSLSDQQTGVAQVWGRFSLRWTEYAESLPGLLELIARAPSSLPT